MLGVELVRLLSSRLGIWDLLSDMGHTYLVSYVVNAMA